MSFWTGFTTGLASSVDKGLQRAIEKRDGELSAAKKFWMQREATKREKYDIKKEKNDAEVLAGYTSLLEGFGGDKDRAKAAFDILVAQGGGVQGVTSYLEDARKRAGELPTGYTINEDFKDFVAGDSKFGGTAEDLMMKPYQGTQFKAANYGVGKSRFDELLGRTGADTDTARLEKQMNVGFDAQPAATPAASTGAFGSIDRSRLSAAEQYQQTQEERTLNIEAKTLGIEKVELDMDATSVGIARTKQATKLDAEAAELAQDKFASAEKQQEVQNKRAEAEALRRQTELIMKAEKHVVDMEAAGLSVEEQKREAAKAKQHPEFASFEKAIIFAKTQLARSDLTDIERKDFEKLSTDMTAAALAYNTEVENQGGTGIEFAKQSLDSIIENARKFELEKVPQKDIGGKVEYAIDGNEAAYYGGMDRALNTAAKRLTPEGEGKSMPAEAKRYIDSLRADNIQKAYGFAVGKEAEYNNAKSTVAKNKVNFVPWNKVSGLQNAQQLTKYAKENIKAGAVVPLKEDGSLYGIWTGTKFVKAQDMDR